MDTGAVVSALVGALVGAGIASIVLVARQRRLDSMWSALESELRTTSTTLGLQLEQVRAEVTRYQGDMLTMTSQQARAEASAASLERELVQAKFDLQSERTVASDYQARLASTDAQLAQSQRQLAETKASADQMSAKFHTEFETIANRVVMSTSDHLNAASQAALATVLNPLQASIAQLGSALSETRAATSAQTQLLKTEVERIGSEALSLSRALRGDVKALGNWGEHMLDEVLTLSGLQVDVHYRTQHGVKDADGKQRVLDAVVNLPEKRGIVIDSKVSLIHYQDAIKETDPERQRALLSSHVQSMKAHVNELSRRSYQDIGGGQSSDFVLMYVPIEGALLSALSHDTGLFNFAMNQQVLLVSNSTLLATLRSVAHVWRLVAQQKNAEQIAALGGQIYDKVRGFVSDFDAVGKSLDKAKEVFQTAHGKLTSGRGNLLSKAERLRKMGVRAVNTKNLLAVENSDEADDDEGVSVRADGAAG
jgi:DNA recombination protein RmuC